MAKPNPKFTKEALVQFALSEGAKYGVPDPQRFAAQLAQESQYRYDAVSPVGAKGVGQLMPDTAKRFGVTNVYDPYQSITAAAKYMGFLTNRYGGDQSVAERAYNTGEGNMDKILAGKKKMPRETANYSAAIDEQLGKLTGVIQTAKGRTASEQQGFADAVARAKADEMRGVAANPAMQASGAPESAAIPSMDWMTKLPNVQAPAMETSMITADPNQTPGLDVPNTWRDEVFKSAINNDGDKLRADALASMFDTPTKHSVSLPDAVELSISKILKEQTS